MNLEQAVIKPPTVSPDTLVTDAIKLMSAAKMTCRLDNTASHHDHSLAEVQSSCVLVMEVNHILGILTETDVVRLTAEGRQMEHIEIAQVMNENVITIKQSDFPDIFTILSLFERHQIFYLPVLDHQGELLGVVTQTTLLQALNPREIYKLVGELEQKVSQLETENLRLLQSHDLQLEAEVQERTIKLQVLAEREQLLSTISNRIRASLNLQDTLDTIVIEIQQFLKCDRVYIYQFNPDWSGVVVAESATPELASFVGKIVNDPCLSEQLINSPDQNMIRVISDIYKVEMSECHRQLLVDWQIRSKIIVPIFQEGMLWGLLSAIETNTPRDWELEEVTLLQQLSIQAAIAIQQAKTYECSQIELLERQRMEREIRLLQNLTQLINEAEDFHTALEATLHQICEFTGWSFGEVWLPSIDNTHLQLSNAWYSHNLALDSFRDESIIFTFGPNEGMPGRIWVSQQPEWILNILEEPINKFVRLAAAQTSGLKGAFGVPILAQKTVVAIMLFFDTEAYEFDESLNQLITSVTFQLGQIIQRKQIEDALRQSQMRYAYLAAAAPVGIFCTDANGSSMYVNERLCQILGITAAETMGNGWMKALHPDDYERWETEKNLAIQEQRTFRLEYRFLRPNGEIIWVLGQVVAEKSAEGEITGYIGTITDITERKQAEIDLQKLAEAAASLTGQDFFPAVVKYIATALGVRYVIVLQKYGDYICTQAFWGDGQIQPHICMEVDHLFSVQIMAEDIYSCVAGVQQEFPEHKYLQNLGVDSFLGIALKNIDGYAIGTLCILDDKPLSNISRVLAILKIFAARISAELERQRAMTALQQLNQELETRVEQRTAALRESEERWQLALQGSNDGIWDWNLITNRVFYSTRWKEMRNFAEDEISDSADEWFTRIHLDDYDRVITSLSNHFAQKTPFFHEEYRVQRQDGSYKWVSDRGKALWDERGNPIRIVGSETDITERKHTEEQFRKLTDRLTLAVKSGAIGIWEWNLNENVVIWDDRMYELYKLERSHSHQVYQIWINSVHPHDRAVVETALEQTLIGKKEFDQEFRIICGDGEIRFIKAFGLIQRDQQGQVAWMIGINFDISDRKQSEEELRKVNERLTLTNADLHRATHLKDVFLANMSHELRTPLNAILGMSEGLQENVFGELNGFQQQAIATIERSGMHLLELINDILDLSKIESGKLELQTAPVAITYLCESSLVFIKQQAIKKNLQITTELPPRLPDIVVDERRIRQVLINLLNNAVKFTENGSIKLVVKTDQDQETNFLCFSVIDTGIGISPENLSKLFLPFEQIDSNLNRQYNGTGLGLSLVRRLIELHEGTVSVSSEIGQGSCFTISLPYVVYKNNGVQPISPSTTVNQSWQEKPSLITTSIINPIEINSPTLILLAEDNEANITTISSYLEARGYHLILARNGEEAVNLTKTEYPDLIIMDIQMPQMDGLEAIHQIRAEPQFTHTPIIALTALAMPQDCEKCITAGANHYSTKPVKLKRLVETIQTLLQGVRR